MLSIGPTTILESLMGKRMKAKIRGIGISNVFNTVAVNPHMNKLMSTGLLKVTIDLDMKAKDFMITKDFYKIGTDVDVFLTVKKRKGKKNANNS